MGAMKEYLMEMEEVAHNLIIEKIRANGEINPHCRLTIRRIFLDRYPNQEQVFDNVYNELVS